ALSLVCMAGGGGQAAAQQPAEFTVALSPVVPPAGTNLRWSPKGAVVALRRDGGALVGAFPLGDSRADSVGVKLDRMQGAAHFDVLWVDTDRNGRWSANERFATTPTLIRGEWWSSFDNVVVRVPEADGGSRPYPMALWFVADTSEPDAPPQLRWSRRGWHAGEVAIGGKPAYVLITEFEMDGVFDQRDAWAISRDSMALLKADARKLDEHAWLDGVAYRPTKIDPDGRSISFVKIDPGTTEAEEIAKKDIYAPDRAARRAAVPLAFDTSLAGALARARRDHRRVLIAFDAVWCGPCHVMDQLVYTAADVVAAAGNVIAVKVDGDEHRDLKQRYKVDGFPTVILLDSDGKELRRGVGYQSVADMVALLRK
ncbi:MAG: thioredoxin family protein, partial [Gemmatimonadales bacterium]